MIFPCAYTYCRSRAVNVEEDWPGVTRVITAEEDRTPIVATYCSKRCAGIQLNSELWDPVIDRHDQALNR